MESKLRDIHKCFKIINLFISNLDTTALEKIPDGIENFAKGPPRLLSEVHDAPVTAVLPKEIMVGGTILVDELREAIDSEYSECIKKLETLKKKIKNESLKQTIYMFFAKDFGRAALLGSAIFAATSCVDVGAAATIGTATAACQYIYPAHINIKISLRRIAWAMFIFGNMWFVKKAQKLEIDQLINFYDYFHENELIKQESYVSITSLMKPFNFAYMDILIGFVLMNWFATDIEHLRNTWPLLGVAFEPLAMSTISGMTTLSGDVHQEHSGISFHKQISNFVNLHKKVLNMDQNEFNEHIKNMKHTGNSAKYYDTMYYSITWFIPFWISMFVFEKIGNSMGGVGILDFDLKPLHSFLRSVDSIGYYLKIEPKLHAELLKLEHQNTRYNFTPLNPPVNIELNSRRIKNRNNRAMEILEQIYKKVKNDHRVWMANMQILNNQNSANQRKSMRILSNEINSYLNDPTEQNPEEIISELDSNQSVLAIPPLETDVRNMRIGGKKTKKKKKRRRCLRKARSRRLMRRPTRA